MGQVFHGSATTTHAVREAIQRSKASLKKLSQTTVYEKLHRAEWMEKRFGRHEHLPQQIQDPLQCLPVVRRIENGLSNAVKAMAKQALRGSLMRLERNRLDRMPPGSRLTGPATSQRQDTTDVSKRLASRKWVASRLNPLDSSASKSASICHRRL